MAYTPTRGQFKGQSFPSYRQYRNASAQARGFANLGAQERASKPITSATAYEKLKAQERDSYRRSLEAINKLRKGEAANLADAARDAGTTPNTVRKYADTALFTKDGKVIARAKDSLVRPMRVITTEGVVILPLENSRDARLAARHASSIGLYLNRGGLNRMRRFVGKFVTVNGVRHYLATERTLIESLAVAGELDFETLYEDVA